MNTFEATLAAHEFQSVAADGERCSCGVILPMLAVHFFELAMSVLEPDHVEVTETDMARTRGTLRVLAKRQDSLGARATDLGLVSFIDRAEWCAQQRTPDEALAWQRRWAALGIHNPDTSHRDPAPVIRLDTVRTSTPERHTA